MTSYCKEGFREGKLNEGVKFRKRSFLTGKERRLLGFSGYFALGFMSTGPLYNRANPQAETKMNDCFTGPGEKFWMF